MTSEAKPKSRVNWVDAAKGLGILLVLIGHAPVPLTIKLFIYAFHMPLFFWLGGLFIKPTGAFDQFFKDKSQRLLWPYIITSFISFAIWMGIRGFSKMAAAIHPMIPLIGIFYGVGSGDWMPHNTPLWFLPCLLSAILLLFGMARWLGGLLPAGLLVCSIIGYFIIGWIDVRLPWSSDVALTAVVFVGTGYLVRRLCMNSEPLHPLALGAMTALGMAAAWMNAQLIGGPAGIGMIDMNNGVYGNYFLFYLAAFCGIGLTVDIAKRVAGLNVLSLLGKHSLSIFCMHMLVYLFVTIAGKIVHVPLALTYERLMVINPGLNPLIAILAYVIPGLLVPLALALGFDWLKEQASTRSLPAPELQGKIEPTRV